MKYYTITCNPDEEVLISYMFRVYGALVNRLKTRIKLYIPEENVKNKAAFVSLCRYIPQRRINLTFGKIASLDKLPLVDYAELLFDSKAEDL